MINIRHGLFETNSSSTHAICIAKKNEDLVIPEKLVFTFNNFGWEDHFYYETKDKASYFYTALYNSYNEDIKRNLENIKNHIYEVLYDAGCECEFTEPKQNEYGWIDSGYIDHHEEVTEWLYKIVKNDKMFFRFLFSPDSFIVTGNDNTDSFGEWEDEFNFSVESEMVDVYYKGN